MNFSSFRAQYTPLIQQSLATQVKWAQQHQLHGGMAHLLGRGKLFRPLLALAVYQACTGNPPDQLCEPASTLEMIHTFTLIHDDLPCMDDAELRRGVPAVHRAYPEAVAVLAGDALLNLANLVLTETTAPLTAGQRLQLLNIAAVATHQVVEGQILDLEGEGRELNLAELQQMHHLKTGALVGACCAFGAVFAGQDDDETIRLTELGLKIGLAFQIRDDLLSIESNEATMGKTLSTDEAKNKATYPRLLGIAASKAELLRVSTECQELIAALELREPGLLAEIAQLAVDRQS